MVGPVWAIIVAAGQGSRFGGPKQFEQIAGRTVLEHSVRAARSVAEGVVVVVPRQLAVDPRVGGIAEAVVGGGDTRSESVRCGLAAVPADATVILVHDAARPLASPALFAAVVGAITGDVVGAIPGLPVADTVKHVADGVVVGTVDRGELVRVGTPQGFVAAALRAAHASSSDATDDAGLIESAGGRVAVVPGEESNMKITTPDDLELARWWYERLNGSESDR